ncbi:hypothetical protein KH990_01925 [Methanoculleus bourgensis]|jgi:hypothetical protein|uniref:hypothetical protein n=1 Tax=Methanoculleus bourgensis TaxID=83986 RepID=UPI001BDA4300|nr:hypothetical protein [Methanoculleus bourgensis]MBT0732135.1 hypothetical protein [Methanoculleus bourgensis]
MEPSTLSVILERASPNFSEENDEDLYLLRKRLNHHFRTPFELECQEEVTFYNNTQTAIEGIYYPLEEFQKHLHIFDSNGASLEFYSNFYNDRTYEPYRGDRGIFIAFPENRHLAPQEVRTIRLEYLIVIPDYRGSDNFYRFIFNLDDSPRTYISFENPSSFYFDAHLFIHGVSGKDKNGEIFSPENLKEFNHISIEKNNHSIYFHSGMLIEGCKLIFIFKHRLSYNQIGWYTIGAIFGVSAIIALSYVLYAYPQLSLTVVLPVAAVVNTYLLITKGWLFQTGMDKIMRSIRLTEKHDLNIDLLYGAIIIVLIGLIMYAIYTGCYLYDEPIQTYRFILNEIEILS